MNRKYNSLYERLVANTRLEREDDYNSCWLWTGPVSSGYPRLCVRDEEGRPRLVSATRLMLEEFHDIWFPWDEAGHLCENPMCVSPLHLEVQTRALNMLLIPGQAVGPKLRDACLIPLVAGRHEDIDRAIDHFWEYGGTPATSCPF